MTNQQLIRTIVLLGLLVLTGCDNSSKNHTTLAMTSATTSSKPNNTRNAMDPACQLILEVPSSDRKPSTKKDIAYYQQAIRQSNSSPIPQLERLGWAFISKARESFDPSYYKYAEQTALCMESKQPNRPETLLLRGHVYNSLHKFKQAENLARTLVNNRGLWFDYGLLGDALLEQGKLENAITAYQSMINQRPGPQAYSRAAQIRWLKGDVGGAIEMMRLVINAQGYRDHESAAWAQTQLAKLLIQTKDINLAKSCIDRALILQKDYPPALLLQGKIKLFEGNSDDAVIILTKAIQLNPLPEYQWVLIEALRESGRNSSASRIEEQIIHKGAVEDPRTTALYLATNKINIQHALHLSLKELEVRADVYTLDAIAWAYYAVGKTYEARLYSLRALAEGTQDARLFFHAGIIANSIGDKHHALELFNLVKNIQHTLLPSENSEFTKEFSALALQMPVYNHATSTSGSNIHQIN